MKTNIISSIAPLVIVLMILAFVIENIGIILLFIGLVVALIITILVCKKQEQKDAVKRTQVIIKSDLDRVKERYGTPDRLIFPKDRSKYGFFALFVKHKLLCINNKEIKFSDIASYKLVDNYFIKNGKISGDIETTTNRGSLIGRSLEGAYWGGSAGAIIGGATASKSSSLNISQGNDKLIHDYTLLLNLKGINRERVEIYISNDWRLAAELEHLFNQIIEYNLSK